MTPSKHIQFLLDQIADGYGKDYADRIWKLTEEQIKEYQSPCNGLDASMTQVISMFTVMGEEGFSHSERGTVFMKLFENLVGQNLSQQAWEEIQQLPDYELRKFSPEVSAEIERLIYRGEQDDKKL